MVKAKQTKQTEVEDTKEESKAYQEQVNAKQEAVPSNPYQSLIDVLNQAYRRAAQGKGKDRHATNESFSDQSIVTEGKYFYIVGNLQQIRKKAVESLRLDPTMARNELLDIIVYAAASIIIIDKRS